MDGTGMRTPTTSDAAARYSYLFPIGYSNSSECGYCRRNRSGQSQKRYSYYAIATSLTPEFYQKLVNRCWRRSGTLLYRPNPKDSCCPHYTLRLDSTEFRPTKDQRQAVNRFSRYILGDTYAQQAARLHPRPRAEARRRRNEFDLVERIHEPETRYLKPAPPSPAHELTVTLEPDTFTEEKYAVFENYQRVVHREPPSKISRHGFRRFLCDSPLTRGTVAGGDGDGRERRVGSFHQCYRIDGRLVAVGVLDLLPDCVSAVYFLYHESIHWLNPGKLGAMREIALAREEGYRWWYPGYYVHNCPKMRYKIEYKPQYVLDPESLQWFLLDKRALALFDRSHYVCFSRGLASEGEGEDAAEEGKGVQAQGNSSSGVEQVDTSAAATSPNQETSREDKEQPPQPPPEPNKNQASSDEEASSEEGEGGEELDAFLLTSSMPGIPTLEQMRAVDMDALVLRSDFSDHLIPAGHLAIWDLEDIAQHGSIKSRIAELVAAVGPDLLGEVCVDFRKRG
ncbi:hypothetical protein VTK26DRAFT_7665 [Humicola hyalothermophila]